MAEHTQALEAGAREAGSLLLDDHFAIVPEWVLDAPISDCALRLYAVLLRYGHSSGARMPGRTTLARRLRKNSTDTVDRAMRELVGVGAVAIEHRSNGRQQLTNRYHVRTHRPAATDNEDSRIFAATPVAAASPGRTDQATPGRIPAGTPAANLRPNPESFTQNTPPPPPPATIREEEKARSDPDEQLLDACGITDLNALADRCQQLRRDQHLPTTRWAAPCLRAALHLAVVNRGWPAEHAQAALLAVAAEPTTRSPMRLAEAGPWWDRPISAPIHVGAVNADELVQLEQTLDDTDGLRPVLQARARQQLADEGAPATRIEVMRRAVKLLSTTQSTHSSAAL